MGASSSQPATTTTSPTTVRDAVQNGPCAAVAQELDDCRKQQNNKHCNDAMDALQRCIAKHPRHFQPAFQQMAREMEERRRRGRDESS